MGTSRMSANGCQSDLFGGFKLDAQPSTECEAEHGIVIVARPNGETPGRDLNEAVLAIERQCLLVLGIDAEEQPASAPLARD